MTYSSNYTGRNDGRFQNNANKPNDGGHVKDLYDELGSDPSGASADLTARLTAMDSAIASGSVSAEFIRDTIAAALQAGSNVTITPNDGADTITIASNTLAAEEVRDTIAGFVVAGSNMTVTHDDNANTLTFASSGGSGGAAEVGLQVPVVASDAPTYQKNWAAAIAAELGIASLVCDGTADNVQIQAAIDAAEDLISAGFGAHVILSSGNFYLANDASIVHHPRVKVTGQGVGNTIVQPSTQTGWTAITMGGYTTGRPLWDMYFEDNASSGGGTSELAALTLDGTSDTGSGRISGLRVHHNTNNGSTHPVVGPDAFHTVHHIGITDVSDIGLWIPGATTGLAGGSADTQACHFHNIRIFHTGSHGVVAGGADNLFHMLDVGSTGNKTLGSPEVAYGYWIDGGNHHFTECKAWYTKRAGVAGTSLSGVGFYVDATRVQLDACEVQESYNHGFYFNNFRGTANSLMAHSCGTDGASNTTGRSSNDCAGFYFSANASNCVVTGYAFNQGPASTNAIAYGAYFAANVPNSLIAITWYSASYSGTPAPTNFAGTTPASSTLYYFGGHSSVPVSTNMGAAAGSSSASTITKYRTVAGSAVTGTTLTADATLTATITGGASRWYEYEALVIVNGDTSTDGKVGLVLTPSGTSATTELNTQWEFIDTAAASKSAYDYETQTGTAAISHSQAVELAGTTGGTRRSVLMKGVCFVGTNVTTATLAVTVAESGGTGTGIIVGPPSYLKVTAVNAGTVS